MIKLLIEPQLNCFPLLACVPLHSSIYDGLPHRNVYPVKSRRRSLVDGITVHTHVHIVEAAARDLKLFGRLVDVQTLVVPDLDVSLQRSHNYSSFLGVEMYHADPSVDRDGLEWSGLDRP